MENIKKQKNFLLILFICIFFIKGLIYAVYITPPAMGTAPDDVGHLSYIQYIASEKKLPVLHITSLENITTQSWNLYQNRQYQDYIHLEIRDEAFDKSNGKNWIAQHPPLYYLLMVPIYAFAKLFTNQLALLIIVLRISTLLFGVASVYVINRILDILEADSIVRNCILISFVFFTPIQYYFSNITNDSLLIFLCLLTLFFLLQYIYQKKQKSFYLFVIGCTLVFLTKYTGALVLIGYLLFLLYKSYKEYGIKYTTLLFCKGSIIGLALISPLLIRNYTLYHAFFPVYDINTRLYNYNIYQFIAGGYINELYRHLITLIGWTTMIAAPRFICVLVAMLVTSVAYLYCLDIKKNKSLIATVLLCFSFIFVAHYFLTIDWSASLAITSGAVILVCIFYKDSRLQHEKEIDVFFVTTIIIVFIVFAVQHYIIFCHRGHTGAMHGRYYYIAIFPMLYLIYNRLSHVHWKLKKYIPAVLMLIIMSCELYMMKQCVILW